MWAFLHESKDHFARLYAGDDFTLDVRKIRTRLELSFREDAATDAGFRGCSAWLRINPIVLLAASASAAETVSLSPTSGSRPLLPRSTQMVPFAFITGNPRKSASQRRI